MIKGIHLQQGAKKFNSRIAFFVPHSFLFAILITFTAYLLGIFKAYQGPFDMIRFWINGFWSFLSFSMQMVLMVVAGFSIASVPLGRKILRSLAVIPRTPRMAVLFLTVISAFCSWIHWGVGMVLGAFLAREMGRRIQGIDYPFLVACAYVGMGAGTFGAFASEPQMVSQAGHFLENAMGVVSLAQTSFSTMTLCGCFLGTIAVTVFLVVICPRGEGVTPLEPSTRMRFDEEDRSEEAALAAEKEMRQKGDMPIGVWLEHSRWPVWLISLMGFSYIVYWFYGRGLDLNLNILNSVLLFLALTLHDTPMRFLKSMENSVRAAHGIIVQFPFYGGIQGMLAASGLAMVIFGWMVTPASEATYPWRLYLEGVVVNFFIPTSGGSWEVQGPMVVKAAQAMNVSIPRAINAFTAGEVIGNIIQPFWAIPLLGICHLALRQIMGYCLMAFFLLSLVWVLCLTFLPL